MKLNGEVNPPGWANLLLKWFCSKEVIETLQGDLYELYAIRKKRHGKLRADFGFVGDVFSAMRPFAMRRILRTKNSNTMSMFKNYLKVAWRNLLKHKMYSSIKIGGLAIGIAACLLITLFVIEEVSHDRSYPSASNIYRLIMTDVTPGEEAQWTAHQPMVARMMKEMFPEVENAGRLIPYSGWAFAGDNQIRRSDRKQNTFEEGFAYMDPDLIDILGFNMVYGDPKTALSKPNSIVISKSKADKFFPNESPIGKTIVLEEDTEKVWEIGGVMDDPNPRNHLPFDYYLTLTNEEFWEGEQTNWCCSNYNVYLKIEDGVDPEIMKRKLTKMIIDTYIPYLRDRGDQWADQAEKFLSYDLQPITDIHLYSKDIHDGLNKSDIQIVYLFAAISIFILILACINFINLSTAKSANRAKEVGLRKVVGSYRTDLIKQFLTESLVITGFATTIGVFLAWVLIPFFNTISGKILSMPFDQWWFYAMIFVLILLVGIISGIYPSFYLSAFRPIEVIKGKLSKGAKTSTLRGIMVVFQFTCSIILIIGSMVVYKQMKFILSKDLGYDKEQVVLIQGANTLGDRLEHFQNELKSLPSVVNVSATGYLPISGTKRDQNQFWKEGRRREDVAISSQIWRVDDDFIETLGMQLLEGRDFEPNTSRDSSSLIINETFARELGLKDPIGKRVENWENWTIIGVVKDFHFESIRGRIGPLALASGRFGSIVPVKVETDDMQETLESITKIWEGFMPNQPIRYAFMDDEYASMYKDVERTGNVFTAFSFLAIFVACLGLFGLSAFMIEQRIKEISIRKVLGASIPIIFKLLTLNFMKLILISLFLAIPVSFYLMTEWLADFRYRIDLTWTIFVFSGLIITIVALLTISTESIRAAAFNPVRGLRSE